MNLQELPALSLKSPPRVLRLWGVVATTVILVSVFTTDPRPALHGDGLGVVAGLVVLIAGLSLSLPRRPLPPGRRFAGLALAGVASWLLQGFQPHGAGFAGLYFVMIVGALRLERTAALAVCGTALAGELVVIAVTDPDPLSRGSSLFFGVVPWYLIMRLIRELKTGRDHAEALVEELRESRAAQARAAAMAERGRVARDMHDVLAHSLSALALQLEGARLLARDRDADPEVVAAVERAHHLAAGGLAEARQAIAALRGEELPGPERLRELADAFAEHSRAGCELIVTGEPRELTSEARLALYRTAQEALTNVRKHSAADRVEIRLEYADAGTTLTVRDFGPGAPVAVGAGDGGYGLTGMRERAELLGGRLTAAPTADGFLVELWLPA